MKLIELLAEDTIDKAWLNGFNRGYNEGVIALKGFAKKLKESISSSSEVLFSALNKS